MTSLRLIQLITIVPLLLIAISGFWLGAFATFGGYIWVQQTVSWSAFAIGAIATIFLCRLKPKRWPFHLIFFAVSQFLFSVAVSTGQVFYFSPESWSAAIEAFGLAMKGRL
jgi:hypothetical protein